MFSRGGEGSGDAVGELPLSDDELESESDSESDSELESEESELEDELLELDEELEAFDFGTEVLDPFTASRASVTKVGKGGSGHTKFPSLLSLQFWGGQP